MVSKVQRRLEAMILGLYQKLESFLLKSINHIWVWFIILHEWKNIFRKRDIYKNVKLTKNQKKQIDAFFTQSYGKKVPYYWHRLYQSYTGEFDYKYIPEIIFSTKLEPNSNKRIDVLPFENKNMLSVLFNGLNSVRTPTTYVMCINGRYFDSDRRIISQAKAIEILNEIHNGIFEAVIKITVDTSSGKGVRMLNIVNGIDTLENEPIKSVLDKMGKNFVVQEKIRPHNVFSNLYPKAINTLRVITYIVDDKIIIAPIIMRIGQGGGMVDNAHAGGMFIGVTDDGTLLKEAFTEYQKRYMVHPDTNVVFEGYKLPCVKEIEQIAIRLHQQIPMLGFISWDFTVDDDDNVVLIESNLHSQSIWMSQIAHGKAFFGDNTAKMLSITRK